MQASMQGWLAATLLAFAATAQGQDQPPLEAIGEPSEAIATPKAAQAFLFPPLSNITLGATAPSPGTIPLDRATELFENVVQVDSFASRGWDASLYEWRAPLSHHQPLYFEQPALERYGQTYCSQLQPLISTAHFFGCVAALPVKASVAPPASIIYTIGRYRPGGVTPSRLPVNL